MWRRLVARVLLPIGVLVKDALGDGEHAASLLEAGVGEALLVETVVALEGAEANHVVATPVLVKELAAALIEEFLERGLMV